MKYQVSSIKYLRPSIFLLVFGLIFFVLSLNEANASRLYFEGQDVVNKGQSFEVTLKLDTEGVDINAIEGTIMIPSSLRLRQIKDGSSLVTLWIEEPALNENRLSFSGIIPGGYSGEFSPYWKGLRAGEVFSLIFESNQTGSDSLTLTNNTEVLLNDGRGTRDNLVRENFKFLIVEGSGETKNEMSGFLEDFDDPEDFEPVVTSDPSLFEGKHFVLFKAQDKGAGINYYEISERKGKEIKSYDELEWKRALSPYLLEDQSLDSFLYIKAVDRNGNIKVVVLPPRESTLTSEIYTVFAILIVLVLFALFRKKFKAKT